MITETALYLGPAIVLDALRKQGRVEVRFPDGETTWARFALAIPYVPAVGDEVLVISQSPTDTFVIGVLRGEGITTLRVPADLTIEAPAGHIRLVAAKGIQVRSGDSLELVARKTTLRATRLNIVVTTLMQRVSDAYIWATGLWQMKARRQRTVTDEGWLLRAGRAHVKTEGNTTINGKTIHLG